MTIAWSQETVDEFVGACHGDTARVRALLEEDRTLVGATASWGETPIQAAAQMANREIIKMLLAAGAEMDICTAAVLGRADEVERMLSDSPGLAQATGAHGIPLLYYPVIVGNLPLAERILAAGAPVNAGEGMNTPLHGAAMFGQAEAALWLIDCGARLDAPDYEGKSPEQVADDAGHREVAALLRDRAGR